MITLELLKIGAAMASPATRTHPIRPGEAGCDIGHQPRLPGRNYLWFGTAEFERIADVIADVLAGVAATGPGGSEYVNRRVGDEVAALCRSFPIYLAT